MAFNIVLIEPEIPMNTGNIGRLSLASGCNLHLVKPFGFELDDTKLKRAGLDYWKHINLFIYDSIADFYEKNSTTKIAYFSSHGDKLYWDVPYEEDLFLIFGKESDGLSKNIKDKNQQNIYKIPLFNKEIRSLNLANAVSIVVYEGLRQIH